MVRRASKINRLPHQRAWLLCWRCMRWVLPDLRGSVAGRRSPASRALSMALRLVDASSEQVQRLREWTSVAG
ncbi:MAG: hypothetical protein U0794_12075 [Isosphaeraceae bacterium]